MSAYSLEEALQRFEDVVILHPGDVDGIASASLLLPRARGSVRVVFPSMPCIDMEELLDEIGSAELLIALGMGLTTDDALRLGSVSNYTVIMDIYRGGPAGRIDNVVFLNPSTGLGIDYPSVSWLLHDMKLGTELLPLLVGTVTGLTHSRGLWVMEELSHYAARIGLRIHQVNLLSRAIDACHKIGDLRCVESSPVKLLELSNRPEEALKEEMWFKALRELGRELASLATELLHEVTEDVHVYRVRSRYFIARDFFSYIDVDRKIVAVDLGGVYELYTGPVRSPEEVCRDVDDLSTSCRAIGRCVHVCTSGELLDLVIPRLARYVRRI